MKKRPTDVVAIISLVIALLGILWNVFFGYGKLITRIDAIQEDITEIKGSIGKLNDKVDHLEDEFHKMDIRVTTLEQRKP